MKQAFAAYEAARHRLPHVQRAGQCVRLPNLDAIADQIDVFLLDAFGVLNIGDTAVDGVPERVAGLQNAGKRVMVVSNAAGYPHFDLMAKYKRLGYDFDPDDVITSRKATLIALNSEPQRRWGLMSPRMVGREDFDHIDTTFLEDDPSEYDRVEGFLLLGSRACIFRDIRPPIPTTSAHLYRGIRPALTRCREALVFDISFLAFRHVVEGLSFGRIVRRVRAGRRCAPAGRGWHLRRWVHQ